MSAFCNNNGKDVSKVFYHRIPTLIDSDQDELQETIEIKEKELYNHLSNIIYEESKTPLSHYITKINETPIAAEPKSDYVNQLGLEPER